MTLPEIHADLQRRLEAKYSAREVGLANGRQAIRRCANAIRATHRGQLAAADELLDEARGLLDVAEAALAAHPDIYYAGFLQDGQKEYAEARATRALIAGEPLPGPGDLGVGDVPYLNGLAEAVGELRRHLLDELRRGDSARAAAAFAAMDEIYGLLVQIDYPDAMTAGLRRSTDVARSILERTRGDLTLTLVQHELASALRLGPAAGSIPAAPAPHREPPGEGPDPDPAGG
ncbi:MAG TPA: haloacid dehalogenase [Actinomycetes bacterium]|nr:haloacid dehalogenase [Actinomycetes bacterium]